MTEILAPVMRGKAAYLRSSGWSSTRRGPCSRDAVEAIRPWQSKDGSDRLRRRGRARARQTPSAPLDRVIAARSSSSPRCSRTTPPTTARSSPTCAAGPTAASACPTSSTRCSPSSPPRSRARRPAAPGRLPDVHAERQPGPQPRGRRAAHGLAGLAGRAGAHPLRQPAVPAASPSRTSPPATTPTPRCSSRRPSPSARRPSVSPGAASSATARPPASARSTEAAVGLLGPASCPRTLARAGRPTRSAARRRSCCGTWSTTAPTATATCPSTPS